MKRLNIQKAKRNLNIQLRRLTAVTLITLVLVFLAITCVQYWVFTFKCNSAEAAGNETYWVSGYQTKNHWDDPDIVERYENAVAEKKAFIESNPIAGFISSLNGNWFCKVFQFAFVLGTPVVAVVSCFFEVLAIIFIVPDAFKRYLKIRKAQKDEDSKNKTGNGTSSQRRSKHTRTRQAKNNLHRIVPIRTANSSALSKMLP